MDLFPLYVPFVPFVAVQERPSIATKSTQITKELSVAAMPSRVLEFMLQHAAHTYLGITGKRICDGYCAV